jgi:hypothetical protein
MFLGLQDPDPAPDPDFIRQWNRFQVRVSSPHIINTQCADPYVFGPPGSGSGSE